MTRVISDIFSEAFVPVNLSLERFSCSLSYYCVIVFSGSRLEPDHLVGEERTCRLVFLCCVAFVLSVLVCLLFLLVSLVGYDL